MRATMAFLACAIAASVTPSLGAPAQGVRQADLAPTGSIPTPPDSTVAALTGVKRNGFNGHSSLRGGILSKIFGGPLSVLNNIAIPHKGTPVSVPSPDRSSTTPNITQDGDQSSPAHTPRQLEAAIPDIPVATESPELQAAASGLPAPLSKILSLPIGIEDFKRDIPAGEGGGIPAFLSKTGVGSIYKFLSPGGARTNVDRGE